MNDKFQKFKILVRLNWLLPQLNSDGLFLFNFVVWFFLFNFETNIGMMSYDREKILEQAKKLIIEKELIFIEEVTSFLPISKKTFYEWFPIDSNECNEIKEMLDFNKVDAKAFMRKKWKDAEAPALQIALYKLCGTDDENHKLNGSKQEVKQETKVEGAILNW